MTEMTQIHAQQADLFPSAGTGQGIFVALSLCLVVGAAAMAGWAPLGFSIATVFLFAGPHNWMEARFFLSQMPARWGPMRTYFQFAIGGVALLGIAFFLMPVMGRKFVWSDDAWLTVSAVWNSALVLWIAGLATIHGKGAGNRLWIWPVAFLVTAGIWAIPAAWDLILVYVHPLIAVLFLHRVLRRRRPEWLGGYYAALALVPALLALLYLRLHDAAPLAGQDMLTMRITQHAGSNLLTGVSAHFLVSAHGFLEMIHYGVWLVAVPFVTMGTAGRRPWRVDGIPLGRRSWRWRTTVQLLLVFGGFLIILLWCSFLADYAMTRDLYFTVAIVHVLAEFPFLVRLT